MKNINWNKLIQYLVVLIIFAGFVYYGVGESYVPGNVGNKEFPLHLAWSTKLRGSAKEIAITDNVILARSSYSINAVDRADGVLLWKHIFDERTSSVLANNEDVYLVTEKNLYAFEDETGDIKWQKSLSQNSSNYPFQNGKIKDISNNYIAINFISNEFRVYTTQSGDYLASIPAARGGQDACIIYDALYTFDNYPASYDLSSGKLLWEDKSTQGIWGHMCDDGIVYFSQEGVEIAAYDLEAKSILWRTPLVIKGSVGLSDFSAQAEYLFVADTTTLYIMGKQNGILVERITDKERPAYPQIIDNHLLVFFGFDRTIYSYDLASWRNSGILRISPPVPLYGEKQNMYHDNDILILVKGKTIFAYR